MRGGGSYMVLHVDFFVRSMARAMKFYCEDMGFSILDEALLRGPIVHCITGGLYDEVRLALIKASPMGAMIELLEPQIGSAKHSAAANSPLPTGAVSILVPDLAAHVRRAATGGWHPASDVFTVDLPQRGRCRLVFYEDPDANRLEFIQNCGRRDGDAARA